MAGRAEGKLERDLERLYGLPLDEFTAARDALARELKGEGDGEAAERAKKLRKPSRSAAAINRAGRAKHRELKALLSAAAKLEAAQERLLKGEGRRPVEQAVERERAAVDRLMATVAAELEGDGGASEAMLSRARGTLHAVATDAELREELEAGRVTADRTAVGLGGLLAGGDASPARKPAAAGKSQARRALKRAEKELEDAERALGRDQAACEEARERVAAAESAVARSEQRVAEAKSARGEARSALKGA